MPKILTDRKVLDQCSPYIIDQRCITVISGLSSEDLDVLKKILGFSTPGFHLDLIEKRAIYIFDFSLLFSTLKVCVFCIMT